MVMVGFTRMEDGTSEDYALLARFEEAHVRGLPRRLLGALDELKQSYGGYQITRYEHSLQSATRAYRDGRGAEYIVAALFHDVGDMLAPQTHGEMAAAILRPYVSDEIYWIIKHHGLFQTYYYAQFHGGDRNARDRFRYHRYYEACVEFCKRYDQNCFDPAYESLSVEFFEPLVHSVFATPSYSLSWNPLLLASLWFEPSRSPFMRSELIHSLYCEVQWKV